MKDVGGGFKVDGNGRLVEMQGLGRSCLMDRVWVEERGRLEDDTYEYMKVAAEKGITELAKQTGTGIVTGVAAEGSGSANKKQKEKKYRQWICVVGSANALM